jgi:general stress protein 26
LLRQYLGSIDNPDLIIYRIDPERVRYMQEWALEYYEVPLR